VAGGLYLILDLYSRKIVGAEVHDSDDADHAVHLVRRTALAESIATNDTKPVLHGDNGSTLKATTVLAMLQWLGVKPSYSRPRVSDDNAYAESLFRTAKYRPEFPIKGFASLDDARAWAAEFVRWYNVDHRHSGTAASATSARSSATPARTKPSWQLGMSSTPRPSCATRHAGLATRATGRKSARSPSIQIAIRWSTWLPLLKILSRKLRDSGGNYLDARRRLRRGFLSPADWPTGAARSAGTLQAC
jgi:hypothetical protein